MNQDLIDGKIKLLMVLQRLLKKRMERNVEKQTHSDSHKYKDAEKLNQRLILEEWKMIRKKL